MKQVAAVIASSHFPGAGANELHGLVVDIKMAVHSRREHDVGADAPRMYPEQPESLSQALWSSAYSTERPIRKEIPGFTVMTKRIPLRSSNAQLRQTHTISQDSQLNPVGALLQQLQMLQAQQPAGDNLLKNLVIHPRGSRPQSPLRPKLLALPAPPQPLTDEKSQAEQEGALPAPPQPAPPQPLTDEKSQANANKDNPENGRGDRSDDQIDGEACSAEDLNHVVDIAAKKCADKATAKTKGKPTPKTKAKAAAKTKATTKTKATAKPEHKTKHKASHAKPSTVKLGCSKCRGSRMGCGQCRDPSFNGKRFQAKQKK